MHGTSITGRSLFVGRALIQPELRNVEDEGYG